MKVLITGSHFTPAQAVISELKKYPKVEIVYLGRKTTREGDPTPSVESQVLPGLGVKFIPIISGRLQRAFTHYTIPSLLKIPVGLMQSFYYLLREKPDIVLSFGGYTGLPVVVGAWTLSIPVIVHEQTLVSGIANSISSIFASKVAVSFDKDYMFDEKKKIVTGNPIRPEILESREGASEKIQSIIDGAKKASKLLLLVTGGNQGSHFINEILFEALDRLLESFFIVHQTGDSKFADFEKALRIQENLNRSERYLPLKWIDTADFGVLIREADLCVSRAGMNTLIELSLVGLPALVIPLPLVQKNEQVVNARFFAKKGLALCLEQKNLDSQMLCKTLSEMLANLKGWKKSAEKAKEVVCLNAEKKIVQEIFLLSRRDGI